MSEHPSAVLSSVLALLLWLSLLLAGCSAPSETSSVALATADATATAASRIIAAALAPTIATAMPTASATATPDAIPTASATATPDATQTSAVLAAVLAAAVAQTLTAQPSPSQTPTPTPDATATAAFIQTQVAEQVAATVAALPTPAPTLPPAPMQVAAAERTFHPVSLQEIANDSTQNGYVDPPLGQVTLGGVLFDLPSGRNSATTQAESLPNNPTQLTLDGLQFSDPQRVYLLLTGGNTRAHFADAPIGAVVLHFASGARHTTVIVPGWNLREWKVYGDHNVTATQAPSVQQVWTSANRFDSGAGVIDMLTIDLPPERQDDLLERIEVRDESVNAAGSMDPAINLLGVTVLAR